MIWTQSTYNILVAQAKDVAVDLATLVTIDLKLGNDINTNLDYLEYATNLVHGLQYGVLIYQDDHYDYINEQVQILRNKCRKYLNV